MLLNGSFGKLSKGVLWTGKTCNQSPREIQQLENKKQDKPMKLSQFRSSINNFSHSLGLNIVHRRF